MTLPFDLALRPGVVAWHFDLALWHLKYCKGFRNLNILDKERGIGVDLEMGAVVGCLNCKM